MWMFTLASCSGNYLGHTMNTRSEQEQIEHILKESSYVKWLYDNKRIYNGDMLLDEMEDNSNQQNYLRDNGLSLDNEITWGE